MRRKAKDARTKAAQYVRMSTDLQDLSIGIQKAAIAKYASDKCLEIVASYEDEGRSGLQIKNRSGMQKLLSDVLDPGCPYSMVLVYDVSRWGRFQNTDESAYYDYHCLRNGVEVVYVAENFGDANAPFRAVVRNLKRAMAAEYSRELAVKVRAGQVRVVQLGFELGSMPCIGYRRQSFGSDGTPKAQLNRHERKAMQSDRVRWILGPEQEVALVRRIFAMYASGRSSVVDIGRMLAREGHVCREGKPFTLQMVRSLLRTEAVVGSFVWGGRAKSLKGKMLGPPEPLTRADDSVPAIVSRDLWQRVQVQIARRAGVVRSKERLLNDLRRALQKDPALTWIDLARLGCATRRAYVNAFGGLTQAYALVGRDLAVAKAAYNQASQRTRQIGNDMQRDIAILAREHGLEVEEVSSRRHLRVGDVRVALRLVWRVQGLGAPRWYEKKQKPRLEYDYMIFARMQDDCTALDFYFLRAQDCSSFPTWTPLKPPPSINHLRCATGLDLINRMRTLSALEHGPRDRRSSVAG